MNSYGTMAVLLLDKPSYFRNRKTIQIAEIKVKMWHVAPGTVSDDFWKRLQQVPRTFFFFFFFVRW